MEPLESYSPSKWSEWGKMPKVPETIPQKRLILGVCHCQHRLQSPRKPLGQYLAKSKMAECKIGVSLVDLSCNERPTCLLFEEFPFVWRFADVVPCSVFPVFDGSTRQWWKYKQKLRVTQQLTATSNRQRQHFSCIVSMVMDSPIRHIYYEDSLSPQEIQRYRKNVIRYHPFGIGIGTLIVFGISVPESTTGSTEIPKCRISFDTYSQLW